MPRETLETTGSPVGTQATESIFFIRRGWHTDIGFSPEAFQPSERDGLLRALPGAKYLVFGFGDRHYVLAKDKNLLEMVKALFPGPGLILVTGLVASPVVAFGKANVEELHLAPDRVSAVRLFVQESLERGPGSDFPLPFATGPYPGSLFYAAKPRYSLAYTCNSWIAGALRAGGLDINTTMTLFAGPLEQQVRVLPESGHAPPETPSAY